MGMWLQATTVSWMGHWKETVQSTDTVHGTCPIKWQNVERNTETRFCLQTRSKLFVFLSGNNQMLIKLKYTYLSY